MNHPSSSSLINALGGPAVVARLLAAATKEPITPQAVVNWRRHGIPSGRVAELALARGKVLRKVEDLHPENWTRLFPELLLTGDKND
jgi:hypothetical protein